MGGEYWLGGSFINTGREIYQLIEALTKHEEVDLKNMGTDVLIGNAGTSFGFGLILFGPQNVNALYGSLMM